MEEEEENKTELLKSLYEQVSVLIDSTLREISPNWATPYMHLHEDGFYVSLTEEDKYDKTIDWEYFRSSVLEAENDVLIKYLPNFKSLVKDIEKEIESYE